MKETIQGSASVCVQELEFCESQCSPLSVGLVSGRHSMIATLCATMRLKNMGPGDNFAVPTFLIHAIIFSFSVLFCILVVYDRRKVFCI